MWSVGVITYELLSGVPPFPDKPSLPEYFRQMRRCRVEFPSKYWRNVSSEARELILYLLEKDPKKRYTAAQVLEHKWITINCQFEDALSMAESQMSMTSMSTLGKDRNQRLKRILFKNKLHKVVQYLVMMARLRDAMDTLLKNCIGTGVDKGLIDLVKVMAGVDLNDPNNKNDMRRISQLVKNKFFGKKNQNEDGKKGDIHVIDENKTSL
mmetsp:Transcript_35407/g.57118  ORF Transcript_35407/g.57118 Transcript_35407/m.57118 type:complete len:210 (+) Transcript_35407:92-721(+)